MLGHACPREAVAQHPASPGPVDDCEEIVLILLDPDQWNNGDFSSAAFSKTKLRKGSLSVCRVLYTTEREVQKHVISPQLQRDATRRLAGAAVAVCADVRAIATTNRPPVRLFCVIDAPIVRGPADGDYLGHAHLSFSEPANEKNFWSNNDRAAALANLTLAFRKRQPPVSLHTIFAR